MFDTCLDNSDLCPRGSLWEHFGNPRSTQRRTGVTIVVEIDKSSQSPIMKITTRLINKGRPGIRTPQVDYKSRSLSPLGM